MRKRFRGYAVILLILSMAQSALAAGIASNVVSIDHKHSQLSLDWDNGTKKIVAWTPKTKFSVLETSKVAKPEDIHVGSYLRIEGEEKDGKFLATEIVIWEAESHRAPK
jgi:hypothetical protein